MTTAVTVIAIAAGLYALIVLLMFLGQSRLLFLPNVPSRALIATPGSIGLDYEAVRIRTEDGVELDAWFIPAPDPRGVLLFFHGNAGNMSHRLDSVRIFHELGLATLIFDYRGYGQSEGRPSEQGTYTDALAVWQYVTQERDIPPSKIVLFGRSMGASVAAHLADRHTPAGLILESGFTSVPDLAAQIYPWLPVRWLARIDYPTAEYVRDLSSPILIAHSPNDEIVLYEHGLALFDQANEPKTFLELTGGHNDGFLISGARYTDGLHQFLSSVLRQK